MYTNSMVLLVIYDSPTTLDKTQVDYDHKLNAIVASFKFSIFRNL